MPLEYIAIRSLLNCKTGSLMSSTFGGFLTSLIGSTVINPYSVLLPNPQASEVARAFHALATENPETQKAKFRHDLKKLKECTLASWVNDWILDLVRANNQTPDSRIISVGMGKTTRLFRMRSDFLLLDYTQRPKIVQAYKKAKNRVIILDNKVSWYLLV